MGELRRVERMCEEGWREVPFMELKPGDVFRLTEPTGEPVLCDGVEIFFATSGAYINVNVATIHCEKIGGGDES